MENQERVRSNDCRELARARRELYGFLARAFLDYPSEEIVKKVQGKAFLTTLSEMKFQDAFRHFSAFSGDFKGDLDALNSEFSKLFVIPTKRHYVTPYESVYLTGLLFQAPAIAVKRIYGREGLEISSEFNDFPDHIGIELEYMHYLCDKESEHWNSDTTTEAQRYLECEKEFLTEHLGVWTQKLSERILASSNSQFYLGFAELLRAFIDYDKMVIDDSIKSMTNGYLKVPRL